MLKLQPGYASLGLVNHRVLQLPLVVAAIGLLHAPEATSPSQLSTEGVELVKMLNSITRNIG